MIMEPQLEQRAAQHYVGIRTQVAMAELPVVIPQLHSEVYRWLAQQGVEPAGPGFIRYHVIDMAGQLDIALGVPVATALAGNDRIQAGELPAGRYATLRYSGDYAGLLAANKALLDWGQGQGLVWDQQATDHGDAFGARFESYIRDPGNEPDPAQWETEVVMRLADAAAS